MNSLKSIAAKSIVFDELLKENPDLKSTPIDDDSKEQIDNKILKFLKIYNESLRVKRINDNFYSKYKDLKKIEKLSNFDDFIKLDIKEGKSKYHLMDGKKGLSKFDENINYDKILTGEEELTENYSKVKQDIYNLPINYKKFLNNISDDDKLFYIILEYLKESNDLKVLNNFISLSKSENFICDNLIPNIILKSLNQKFDYDSKDDTNYINKIADIVNTLLLNNNCEYKDNKEETYMVLPDNIGRINNLEKKDYLVDFLLSMNRINITKSIIENLKHKIIIFEEELTFTVDKLRRMENPQADKIRNDLYKSLKHFGI